jgi:tyrosyl-DNA phosphodiesterase 2
MASASMIESLLDKQLSYEPQSQLCHIYEEGTWIPMSVTNPCDAPERTPITQIRVITWNIDFMAPQPRARMASALAYLEQLVSAIPTNCAVVIHLQEMMDKRKPSSDGANDIQQLLNASWVQSHFSITDISTRDWATSYGQVTLVDRRLTIARVSRLHLVSEFKRDALFVDVQLNAEEPSYLRFCNVHLDSMQGALRPIQWQALAWHLQDAREGIAASILAGDCNANGPRDWSAPRENGFKDAYLELGGVEGEEEGMTWGFQSLSAKRWGPSRMDKEVFWGAVRCDGLERIGVGLMLEDEDATQEMEDEGALGFVTDHYGLMGSFTTEHAFLTSKSVVS